ncbi:MAG: Ca-activated chloride channel family protein [Cocleimonas sp.]
MSLNMSFYTSYANLLNNLEFASNWVFWLLPLPLLVWWLFPRAPVSSSAALRVPFYQNLEPKIIQSRRSPSALRIFLAVLVWLLLVSAAARPQFVGDTVRQSISGRSLMMAVDISGSMDEADMVISGRRMTRLSMVKIVAGEFIQKREGDHIGLILFGSQAYLQAPLTFDRKTVATLLDESFISLAGRSTAIGDAIGLAVKRLRDEDENNRVLILLTDGANSAGNVEPLKAADLAAQEKIKIYTIGVGSLRSRDLDEPTLNSIAEKTDGRYFRATNVEDLLKIYDLLDQIEPVSQDELSYRPIKELFYTPLAIALFLSALIALFGSGLFKRLTSKNNQINIDKDSTENTVVDNAQTSNKKREAF